MISLFVYTAIIFFITGACIGSFLNVVALRGLKDESIVFPASHCPKCDKKLSWYTNIPIISYIFLRGKCEFCKEHISLQYPIVESLNAILYVCCFYTFGFTFETLFMCAFVSLFMLIAITDFKESVVIDIHTYIIIALGILYNLTPFGELNFIQIVIGIAAGFLIYEGLARLGYIFAGTRAFGEGDTLIAMGLGAIFGWGGLLIVTFLSVVVQAFMAIPVLLKKSLDAKNYRSTGAYCALILSVITVYLFRKFNLYDNFSLVVTLLAAVCAVLAWALYIILKDVKSKKESGDYLYMPFGPALVSAGVLMIFFKPQIEGFIRELAGIL